MFTYVMSTALVTKLLIQYITSAYLAHRAPNLVASGELERPKSIGYGIALAFGK